MPDHRNALVKSHEVIIRVGSLADSVRPVIVQSGTTFAANDIPNLHTFQAATTASTRFNTRSLEFYLIGSNFAESAVVSSQATVSVSSYFQKNIDGTVFAPDSLDEALQTVIASRYDKNRGIYAEVNKFLGSSGDTYYYDRVAFVASVMNYTENYLADNLLEVTFDLISHGTIGVYEGVEEITGSLLLEDDSFLLLEDGGQILLGDGNLEPTEPNA